MAESFVKTFKRDYVAIKALLSAEIVLRQLRPWFDGCNQVHPHQTLKYRSPDKFSQYQSIQTACSVRFISNGPAIIFCCRK